MNGFQWDYTAAETMPVQLWCLPLLGHGLWKLQACPDCISIHRANLRLGIRLCTLKACAGFVCTLKACAGPLQLVLGRFPLGRFPLESCQGWRKFQSSWQLIQAPSLFNTMRAPMVPITTTAPLPVMTLVSNDSDSRNDSSPLPVMTLGRRWLPRDRWLRFRDLLGCVVP